MDIIELAEQNQQNAWKLLDETGIIPAWERIGATVHGRFAQVRFVNEKQGYRSAHLYRETRYYGEFFGYAGIGRAA